MAQHHGRIRRLDSSNAIGLERRKRMLKRQFPLPAAGRATYAAPAAGLPESSRHLAQVENPHSSQPKRRKPGHGGAKSGLEELAVSATAGTFHAGKAGVAARERFVLSGISRTT
jgi:hypothetical protein